MKIRNRPVAFLTDDRMSRPQKIADLEGLLQDLRRESARMLPDTYEILEKKQEINNKMIRWGIDDPVEFGASQGEIDL